MKTARALYVAIAIVAVALFAKSIHVLGFQHITDGLARIGWGFVVILLLAGARDVVRAIAWTLTVERSKRLRFVPAFRARLAGEALNTLLPMGMLVGEPTKASQVGNSLPFGTAFRALAVEFAFYTASLVPLFAAGAVAFAMVNRIRIGIVAAILAGIAFIAVATLVARLLLRRASAWDTNRPWQVAVITACEAAYQILAVAEVYVTLLFIGPQPPTIASAVVLETVSRGITIFFKMVPMRIGVDEASSSFVAGHVSLDPATGLTLALVRKLRMLFWSAVGLGLLARGGASSARARVGPPSAVFPSVAMVMLLLVAPSVYAQDTGAVVAGSVAVARPDAAPLVVPGVTVTLRCAGDEPRLEVSNEQGEFRFASVPARVTEAARSASPITCTISAELQGFSSATTSIVLTAGQTTVANLELGLDTLREEVTVRAPAISLDQDRSPARLEQMTAPLMRMAPVAHDRFQDALPLIPGVVRGPDGLLNISGLRSNQTALTFNSANGTDPVTGEDAIELPIDAVSSVQVRGAAYAPEFGLSAGAVTVVETQKAGDEWNTTVNDLEPRLRRRGGEFKGIESWTPRVTVGGPIVKAKVQLLESVQYEYSQTRVFGLPPFESDTKLQSFETFTRLDWLRNPSNRLTASTLISPRKTTYAGLNTFNPQSVTANIKSDNVLASVSDQIIAAAGVIEMRASVKQFDATIYPSRGVSPMVLAPDVNSGSYFNDQDRTSRRAEWFTTYSFTPVGPAHLIKAGGGLTYETFGGLNASRPVQIVRANGTKDETIAFAGSGRLDRNKTAVRGFAQDVWTAGSRLSILYGARYDYESIAGGFNVAPRGSVSVVATGDGRTVVRAGGGMFYNAVPLNVASFDQYQTRVVTSFADDGTTVLSDARLPNIVESELRAPRGVTWNVEVDREWLDNLFVRVGYQQRDNRDEPVVDATANAIVLRTDGRSRYREGQVTVRYTFHGDSRIVASYTRSSAIGNLNDFNGFFGNIENPVIRPDERGRLPWDAPNRLLVWANLPLPRGFAIFPVLDTRTGFPVSNLDAERNFVGPRNAVGRFPTFVSLDAQITKKFRVLGHNATLGLKVFNITDHFNPRDYQGNLASRDFGQFDNAVGRTFRGKWIFEF